MKPVTPASATIATLTLLIASLGFIGHGLACLFLPEIISKEAGLVIETVEASIEVRAEYGGLAIALGLFFLAGMVKKSWRDKSLLTLGVVCGGLFTARLGSVILEQSLSTYHLQALVFESLVGGLALFCYAAQNRDAMNHNHEL